MAKAVKEPKAPKKAVKEPKAPIATGSNKEPLAKECGEVSCQHTDILPTGNDVLETVEESESNDKTTNVPGIHSGKRPKFVNHPKEDSGDVA